MNSSSVESKALCSNYTLHVCAPVGSSMEELWKHLAAQCILLPIVMAVGIAYVAKTNGYIGTGSVGDEIASSVRDVTQNNIIKLSDKDFFEAARDEEVEEDVSDEDASNCVCTRGGAGGRLPAAIALFRCAASWVGRARERLRLATPIARYALFYAGPRSLLNTQTAQRDYPTFPELFEQVRGKAILGVHI